MSQTSSLAADAPDDAGLAQALRLALVPGVGPQLRQALLDHFGAAEAVLRAAPSQLRQVPGIGVRLARGIADAEKNIDVQAEIQRCREHQIQIISGQDPRYPANLRHIFDPPFALFCQGELLPQDAVAVAIVGTRHATSYGKRQASRLAGALARAGVTVVSGLARGIDAEAHLGALEAGGRTLAVLAGGLLNVYPAQHKELAFDISHAGALLSEMPSLQPVSRGAFPRRNRLITGLSLGVIVVEAANRSGALISARHALEQGREVFAVPGPIDSRVSRGCHALIKDGAKLVETADDVLSELGPLATTVPHESGEPLHHPAELQLTEQERAVLHCIEVMPTNIDVIVRGCGLPVPRVLATLSVLEMRRLIRRVSGNTVVRI